jgi:hypothetical protein
MRITVIDANRDWVEYDDLGLALHDFLCENGRKITFEDEDGEQRVAVSRAAVRFVQTELFDQFAAMVSVERSVLTMLPEIEVADVSVEEFADGA